MADESNQSEEHPTQSLEEEISEEEIDRDLIETFPASDPPPWTLGVERRATKPEKKR
jgi:hypothetical protein